MTRISHADVRRQHLEVIARLKDIQGTDLLTCIANLIDAQPGYPTGGSGGGGAPTLDAAGNPPGLDRYLDKPDPIVAQLNLLVAESKKMSDSASVIHDIVSRYADSSPSPYEGGITPRRTASGGDCVVCATYCSGAHNDRLRAGLCNACRVNWQRSTLDRGEWMLERRRALLSVNDSEVA